MKKTILVFLILTMLLVTFTALAEGMGVQIIGGPEMTADTVSLDDLKLNTKVAIDGYGEFEFTSCGYTDILTSYKEGSNKTIDTYYASGEEAQYLMLRTDILNNTVTARNYLEQVEVVVVFDDVFEYKGWSYQYNYDNRSNDFSYTRYPNGDQMGYGNPREHVIAAKDNFVINPMYVGHYVFGCTLPNAVVDSKKPLRMVITIDGNELTYNIRK